jgi:hypothetical protein
MLCNAVQRQIVHTIIAKWLYMNGLIDKLVKCLYYRYQCLNFKSGIHKQIKEAFSIPGSCRL